MNETDIRLTELRPNSVRFLRIFCVIFLRQICRRDEEKIERAHWLVENIGDTKKRINKLKKKIGIFFHKVWGLFWNLIWYIVGIERDVLWVVLVLVSDDDNCVCVPLTWERSKPSILWPWRERSRQWTEKEKDKLKTVEHVSTRCVYFERIQRWRSSKQFLSFDFFSFLFIP